MAIKGVVIDFLDFSDLGLFFSVELGMKHDRVSWGVNVETHGRP
jgi:hypothetical protein